MLGRMLTPVLVALLGAIAVLVFSAVVFRYALRAPLIFSFELSSLMFAWLIFLGAVMAHAEAAHVRVDLIGSRLSPRAAAAVDLVAEAVILGCCAYLAWYSWVLTSRTALRIASLDLSNRWLYGIVPVGAVLIGAISLGRIVRQLRTLLIGGR